VPASTNRSGRVSAARKARLATAFLRSKPIQLMDGIDLDRVDTAQNSPAVFIGEKKRFVSGDGRFPSLLGNSRTYHWQIAGVASE
jgi:hypothetical protein